MGMKRDKKTKALIFDYTKEELERHTLHRKVSEMEGIIKKMDERLKNLENRKNQEVNNGEI